ncbi:MAG: OsmC family protein [Solirubrobacterales bacterium]
MDRIVSRRLAGFTQEVEVDGHTVIADEPAELGGNDAGPRPTRLLAASLAACTAITMEMYAQRKGWSLEGSEVAVEVEFEGPAPARLTVVLRLPASLDGEQRERLRVIAGKCPVHRALSGGAVTLDDRLETV